MFLSFKEWLFVESYEPAVNYIKHPTEWVITATIGDLTFQITFWETIHLEGMWSVQFYQLDDRQNKKTTESDKVSFLQLSILFRIIDSALQQLFKEHPEIKEVLIHPEAIGNRAAKITRNSGSYNSFDLNKYNAYQFLFQNSQLKQQGFTMHQDTDEHLTIKRPGV